MIVRNVESRSSSASSSDGRLYVSSININSSPFLQMRINFNLVLTGFPSCSSPKN